MIYYCINCGYEPIVESNKCPICGCVKYDCYHDGNETLLHTNDAHISTTLLYDFLHIQDKESNLPNKQKGKRLERFIYMLLSSSDYQVTDNHFQNDPTDDGIDLIAQKGNTIFCIQAKHRHLSSTKLIGQQEVQHLIGAIECFKKDIKNNHLYIKGVLITSHFFSQQAKETAQKTGIELIDKKGLVDLVLQLQPKLLSEAYFYNMTSELLRCPKCNELMVVKDNNGTRYWAHPEYKLSNSKNCTHVEPCKAIPN